MFYMEVRNKEGGKEIKAFHSHLVRGIEFALLENVYNRATKGQGRGDPEKRRRERGKPPPSEFTICSFRPFPQLVQMRSLLRTGK